jgi:type II secretory pathway component PulF
MISDSLRTRSRFYGNLATAIDAGLPVDRALATTAGSGDRLSAAVGAVVTGGHSLSAGLTAQGALFDRFEVLAVEAGERAGMLPQVLRKLSRALEVRGKARDRVAHGLIYPLLLIHGAVLLPPLFLLFRDGLGRYLGTVLPILGVIYGGTVLIWWLHRGLTTGETGRMRRDALLLRLPWVSKAVTAFALADFAHALALLVGAGVPIPEAFDNAAEATRNRVFRAAGHRAGTAVRSGSTAQEALARESALFPQEFLGALAVGESAGKLEETLGRSADTARHDAERWMMTLAIAAATAAYAVAAVVVAWAVISFWVGTTALPDGI